MNPANPPLFFKRVNRSLCVWKARTCPRVVLGVGCSSVPSPQRVSPREQLPFALRITGVLRQLQLLRRRRLAWAVQAEPGRLCAARRRRPHPASLCRSLRQSSSS